MLRFNLHAFKSTGNVFRRWMSTGTNVKTKEQLGPIKRMQNFFSGNKQALLNMIGIYIVLTVSYQNFKTSNRRLELEEKEKINDEILHNVEERINSDEWVETIVERLNRAESATEKVNVLKAEFQKVKKPLPKPDTPVSESDELSLLVKEFTGESSNKSASSGKMI